MEGVAIVFYKMIKLPKGSSFIPTDIISEIKLEKEADYGSDDEAEYVLPMCEMETKKSGLYKNRPAKIMEVTKQKNPAEILSKRINKYRERIVQYLGEGKLLELEELVENIRKIDDKAKEKKVIEDNTKKVEDLGKETLPEQEDTLNKNIVSQKIEEQKSYERKLNNQQHVTK